jgi:hypothetical protein
MNPKYLKDKIFEELDLSYLYIKNAIDSVKVYSDWPEIFKAMSDSSYKHAIELYKMFMQLYKDSKEQDAYMNSVRDAIIDHLAAHTQKIENYKATYDLIIGSSEPPAEE